MDLTNNCGTSHNLDCQRIDAAMIYDPKCVRCTKIKQVIALRRKRSEFGASEEEESAALNLADKLVATYKLTRGEVFDREYRTAATQAIIEEVRVQTRERKRRRNREEISI
jgi:predicted DCC family thiol-disulfide oxidoreductase YuxK